VNHSLCSLECPGCLLIQRLCRDKLKRAISLRRRYYLQLVIRQSYCKYSCLEGAAKFSACLDAFGCRTHISEPYKKQQVAASAPLLFFHHHLFLTSLPSSLITASPLAQVRSPSSLIVSSIPPQVQSLKSVPFQALSIVGNRLHVLFILLTYISGSTHNR